MTYAFAAAGTGGHVYPALAVAGELKEITAALGIPFIYKSSFDKANRSSGKSFRGPGVDQGLKILNEVKSQVGVPVLTDVHEDTDIGQVAGVVDVLQTPAFLCRQTNFIQSVARTGKPVNIKKGQFLAPWDMESAVVKVRSTGNQQVMLTDRGTCFGYNRLITDFRAIPIMRSAVSRPTSRLERVRPGRLSAVRPSLWIPFSRGCCSLGRTVSRYA